MDARDWVEYCKVMNFAPSPLPQKQAPQISSTCLPSGLDDLKKQAHSCTLCPLSQTRKQVVFGEGSSKSGLMLIGEGPGYYEDQEGRPFVGKAGALLDKMIQAMGLKREELYIANVLKCRPPNNRDPLPEEVRQCHPYLKKQIEIVAPKVIVAFGSFAAQVVLNSDLSIGKLRGEFRESAPSDTQSPIQVMATYHPAFLMRNPQMKRVVWEDLQKVMKLLNLKRQ